MSRFGDYDGDDQYNGGDLWTHRAHLALNGKRGRQALRDLREAMLALPNKRLIEGALCTIGLEGRLERVPATIIVAGKWHWLAEEHTTERLEGPFEIENPELEDVRQALRTVDQSQGEGVCAIGAYIWWQKVKAGMDPEEAFATMPIGAEGEHETTEAGRAAGLTFTLAWELANRNDEQWGTLTPEQRYDAFLTFIERTLSQPPLEKPAPRPKRVRVSHARIAARPTPSGTITLGL